MNKKGVILLAYGGPNKKEDIAPFYRDIRMSYAGVEPTQEQLDELIDEYEMIGGKSPLLEVTQKQADNLEKALGEEYSVYIGMRHWEPWIENTIRQMKNDGIEEAVGIVMAPHFSKMSVCKYYEKVVKSMKDANYDLKLHWVNSWHDHPDYIEGVAEKIQEVFPNFPEEKKDDVRIVFTAHSLPMRLMEYYGPYPRQLNETCELIAQKLNHKKWTFSYQSVGKSRMPWLGPDIVDAVKDLHKEGEKYLLVCSIGFIVDHFEVIFDLDIEAKPEAEKLGMQFERAKTLNDSPSLTRTLTDLVKKKTGS